MVEDKLGKIIKEEKDFIIIKLTEEGYNTDLNKIEKKFNGFYPDAETMFILKENPEIERILNNEKSLVLLKN